MSADGGPRHGARAAYRMSTVLLGETLCGSYGGAVSSAFIVAYKERMSFIDAVVVVAANLRRGLIHVLGPEPRAVWRLQRGAQPGVRGPGSPSRALRGQLAIDEMVARERACRHPRARDCQREHGPPRRILGRDGPTVAVAVLQVILNARARFCIRRATARGAQGLCAARTEGERGCRRQPQALRRCSRRRRSRSSRRTSARPTV